MEVNWEWSHLKTGDYSIRGYEHLFAVERKSLSDLYSTLGQHRDRFEEEHWRLSRLKFKAVVIESSWARALHDPPPHSRLTPSSVLGTGLAWTSRYGVPWHMVEDRRLAEIVTFRLLKWWWTYLREGPGWKKSHTSRAIRLLVDSCPAPFLFEEN